MKLRRRFSSSLRTLLIHKVRSLLALTRTIAIPIDTAAVADLPWNFEDRLVVVLGLPRLEVRAPESHDLVLSKISRWSEGDEDHALRLHRRGEAAARRAAARVPER